MKKFGILIIVLILISCNKKVSEPENNTQLLNTSIVESDSTILEIENSADNVTVSDYFVYDFWKNPFLDNNPNINYFGDELQLLLENNADDYVITNLKIDDEDWSEGYYYKIEIKNDLFECYYLSPSSRDSYRRPYLIITGKETDLKSNIRIGMNKQKLIEVVENHSDNEYLTIEQNQILVALEGISVYFNLENDLLISIEIAVEY